MAGGVPGEDPAQGLHRRRRGGETAIASLCRRTRPDRRRCRAGAAASPAFGRRGAGHRIEQVAHARRPGGRLIAEPPAEGRLDAARQFDPGEAVEAEVAIEGGIEPDRRPAAAGLEFADHAFYDRKQSRRRIVGGPRVSVGPGHPPSMLLLSA